MNQKARTWRELDNGPTMKPIRLDHDANLSVAFTDSGDFDLALEYAGKSLASRIDRAFDVLKSGIGHEFSAAFQYRTVVDFHTGAQRVSPYFPPATLARYLSTVRRETMAAAVKELRGAL